MTRKIDAYCKLTGQDKPGNVGQYVRTVLESLALLYQNNIADLEKLTGQSIDRLHVVGGGSQNAFLNQLTANAIQRPVIVGPVEGTAMGNLLLQGISTGRLSSLDEIRHIVRNSFSTKTYTPETKNDCTDKASRFQDIRQKAAR